MTEDLGEYPATEEEKNFELAKAIIIDDILRLYDYLKCKFGIKQEVAEQLLLSCIK